MKLSTADLKKMISTWLDTDEARQNLKHHSEFRDPNRTIRDWANGDKEVSELQYTANLFGCPKVKTPEELEQKIWDMWLDGSQWIREEKRKLKDDWDSYLADYDWSAPINGVKKPYFPIDMLGGCDMELVTKYFNEPKLAEKCVFRCFVPKNQLADNYRLEVVTTPEDDKVIGWTVIVD